MKQILIVDDSPMIRGLLTRTLEKHGYKVCGQAKNGKEGVELYDELMPDLVFMDITMPIMDGLEASEKIKNKYPDSKIIMLSAMGDEEVMEQADQLGIDVFLKKPFNDYNIVSAISKVV
ncbi:MAG: response regulator [Clostridiales bacterium]|nr:response regulator [Clostridiales bacterium]